MLSLGYQWCDVIHGWLYLKLDDKVALPFRGNSLKNFIIMIMYYFLGLRVRWSPLNSHDVRILKTFQYSVALSFRWQIFIRRVKWKQTIENQTALNQLQHFRCCMKRICVISSVPLLRGIPVCHSCRTAISLLESCSYIFSLPLYSLGSWRPFTSLWTHEMPSSKIWVISYFLIPHRIPS